MRYALAVLVSAALCGCGSTSLIKSDAISYDDAIEDVTDKLLLLNILRAKDKAPLHFAEIPSIHESIQESASLQATALFGAQNKSTQRDVATAGVGFQVTPTFEIDHLDTKDFVTGIASPIDPKFVKYWFDRGLDRRVILLLFFSAAEIVESDDSGGIASAIRIRNAPREAISTFGSQAAAGAAELPEELRCDAQSEFQHYLKLINSLMNFSANSFIERRLLVDNLDLDQKTGLKDYEAIGALDPAKFQWFRNNDHSYRIYALSSEPKIALCFSNLPIASGPNPPTKTAACVGSVVEVTSDEGLQRGLVAAPLTPPPIGRPTKPSLYCSHYNEFLSFARALDPTLKPHHNLGLHLEIRSVGEIIQFLGDLLQYQEELEQYTRENPNVHLRLNDPVTFGYCPDRVEQESNPGCADVFFNLTQNDCNSRFSVTYRNRVYSMPNYNAPDVQQGSFDSCRRGDSWRPAPPRDHSLEILAVVHQLIDLQKSAKDIRETPYVQVLP
jgi:hypothetical protein